MLISEMLTEQVLERRPAICESCGALCFTSLSPAAFVSCLDCDRTRHERESEQVSGQYWWDNYWEVDSRIDRLTTHYLGADSVVSATPTTRTQTGDDMPRISEMIQSNYLKKEDIEDDTIVTIVGVKKANIAREDQEAEYKWLIQVKEFEKPMVLNSTNIQLCAKACDSESTDDWKGQQIVIYVDDSVSFGGKLVGGLRIKKLKRAKPATAATGGDDWDDAPSNSGPVTDDQIPF